MGREEPEEGDLMTNTTLPSLIVQPESGLTPVIHALRRAKRTVDVAIFRLTRSDVQEALAAAVARGVKVRALVAHKNGSGENRLRKLEQQLLESGVTVARTGDEFIRYHGKFIIIDDTLHLLGFNLTKADITKTRSFGIRTRDRRAVQDAGNLFESDLTRQPFSAGRSSPLVVSPETSRSSLEKLLSGARKRLAIYDGRLDDPSCVKLIRQRAASGVQVQIIGKAPNLAKEVPIRELKGLRLHVRAIICDGTQAFVGSQSMRRLELDNRREVGLIITNPTVARRMLRIFEEDWEASAKKKEQVQEAQTALTANGTQAG
jgi:phosphatidylserine/phosphatidylglycerophosphate/cardiolipin synthase-like enzyme